MITFLQKLETIPPQFFYYLRGISGILYIWIVVCLWRIFVKAGRKGWESIIPIRHIFVLFKIAKKINGFFRLLPIPIIEYRIFVIYFFASISIINDSLLSFILFTMRFFGYIALAIYGVLVYQLAKLFGKSKRFSLGLFFFAPIFYGILAFDKSKYLGIDKE